MKILRVRKPIVAYFQVEEENEVFEIYVEYFPDEKIVKIPREKDRKKLADVAPFFDDIVKNYFDNTNTNNDIVQTVQKDAAERIAKIVSIENKVNSLPKEF